ncbi:MAG: hypothetical protein JO108_29075 [Acidobacteriaceae bacterium]|nr:hypothetical protein [Acidobacteriaceae bacterium]
MRTRYRSFYISAIAVAGLGLFGSAFVPRTHAITPVQPAMIEVAPDTGDAIEQNQHMSQPEQMDAASPLLGFAGLTALSLSGLLTLSAKHRA